jgi:hypothetical protein
MTRERGSMSRVGVKVRIRKVRDDGHKAAPARRMRAAFPLCCGSLAVLAGDGYPAFAEAV